MDRRLCFTEIWNKTQALIFNKPLLAGQMFHTLVPVCSLVILTITLCNLFRMFPGAFLKVTIVKPSSVIKKRKSLQNIT